MAQESGVGDRVRAALGRVRPRERSTVSTEHAAVLDRLFHTGSTVVMQIDPDSDAIAYVTPNVERVLGLAQADLTSRGFLRRAVNVDDVPMAQRAFARVAAGEVAEAVVELRVRNAHGVERWTSMRLVRDVAAEPHKPWIFVYAQDIDDQRQAELALRDREATLAAIITASPDAIQIVDPTGAIRAASPRAGRLLGYEAGGDLDQRSFDPIHRDDVDRVKATLDRVRTGDLDRATFEFRARHADGSWRTLESRAARMDDGEGVGDCGVVVVTSDVTERVELAQAQEAARIAAEAANRSKSEFLSRMSHELRTPLNAVLGFGQLLELDELTAAQQEATTQILRGGRHLLDLINEVLDIARIESGSLTLSPESVHLGLLLRDTLELMAPLARQHGVALGGPGLDASGYVLADRQRLTQVLLNLLSNAVKYNRVNGSVAVSLEPRAGDRVRINVRDTGPGIAAEKQGLLFTPFERLGAEQTAVEGTGIGLALSRRLTEAMGGTLGVTSTPGDGSTFWVELPVAEGPVDRYERIRPLPAEAVDEPAGARLVIVHIEDNLANTTLVERIFQHRRRGVRVVPAMQGRLGIELVREHQPALVLLDLHLPDLEGSEVLRRLREDPATAGIPVVMISADATPRQVQRLLNAGALAYLTKPVDVPELLGLVDRVLAGDHA